MNLTPFKWLSAGIAAVCGTCSVTAVCDLRLNTTYSLPLGIYQGSSDPHAPMVEFCPAAPFSEISRTRGYRSRGICPDGAAPLLKPIVAREGDTIELTAAGIAINGTLLPNTAPLAKDRHGRKLQPWPYGAYHVQPGTIWVASTYNKGSYDSRYMGPIPLERVRKRLKPLWVLDGSRL